MKTHNAVIYHCLCCGSIVHCEPDVEPPQCCGQEMVEAAAETIHDSEAEVQKGIPDQPRLTVPPVIRARPKPR